MPDTNVDRAVGRLEGRLAGVDKKLEDIAKLLQEQNAASSESRKALYERVGSIETDLEILGQAIGQTRDSVAGKIDGLTHRIDRDIQPTIDEYKKIKLMGSGILWAAGIAGGALTAWAIMWWEHLVASVRNFLR